MKLVHIGSSGSRTKIIKLDDLKDQDGNNLELPPDPENNLVFDPRPNIFFAYYRRTFEIEIQDSARLVVTCTNNCDGWWEEFSYFRVYDRTKEDVPAAFNPSVPYDYWGLKREHPPRNTTVVKVLHTVTTIHFRAFHRRYIMTTCDMSNAPVAEIEERAFEECKTLRSVLFPQVLKKIGEYAFYGCEAIDVLIIPSTVTHIEDCAFFCCENVRIFKLPYTIDLDNVSDNIGCSALLDKVRTNQTPIQWLKHWYDPHQTTKQWLKHRYDPYPLHKVCYNAHVTIEQIQQCIQAHPHAAYLSDEFHMTALHMITIMACTSNIQTQSHNQDEGATRLLGCAGHITACFDGNMSAAFAEDDRGKTPLDYLLESCDGLDVHTGLVTSLCLHRNASSCLYQMTEVRHCCTTCGIM